jgi:hypothetical protein
MWRERTCGGELIVRHQRAIPELPTKHPGPHDVQRCQAFLKQLLSDMPLLSATSIHRSLRTPRTWSLSTINFSRLRNYAR